MIRLAEYADINKLVNDKDIKEMLGLSDFTHIDMGNFYNERNNNVAFISPAGGMLFGDHGKRVYESHFMFYPRSNTADIMRYAREMHAEMFTKYKATVIKGHPPRGHRAVRTVGVALGYEKVPNTHIIDELERLCDIYEMRREKWETLSAGLLAV